MFLPLYSENADQEKHSEGLNMTSLDVIGLFLKLSADAFQLQENVLFCFKMSFRLRREMITPHSGNVCFMIYDVLFSP